MTFSTLREVWRQALETRYRELGLSSDLSQRLSSSGRLSRSVIVYTVADRSDAPSALLELCLAVEQMHRASVLVDDIEDGDSLRREVPCLHSIVGIDKTLAIADLVLSDGLLRLSHLEDKFYILEALRTYRRMSLGQALDVGALELNAPELDYPASLKTGSLVSMCFKFGGRFGGFDDAAVSTLGEIGMHLGMAFQLHNDLNNVLGDEGRGFGAGSDLARQRMTSVSIALPGITICELRERREWLSHLIEGAALDHHRKASAKLAELGVKLHRDLSLLINDVGFALEFVSDQTVLRPE